MSSEKPPDGRWSRSRLASAARSSACEAWTAAADDGRSRYCVGGGGDGSADVRSRRAGTVVRYLMMAAFRTYLSEHGRCLVI